MVVSYDIESLVFEVFAPAPLVGPVSEADPVICRCLQVRESAVVEAVEVSGCQSLCQLACSTGAGSGCTACHRKLRQYFADRRHAALEQAADKCGS
ncbi:MAG: (2Fe-2S)-binding protein [Planctomycetia bacterium]|nr:(2Fe-2S)-binding protein [Planctomycetia bacterium]